ncbi:MAG: DUF6340 family protein [Bacteroidota bacterium]
MKNLLLFLLAPAALFCSCSATNHLTIGLTVPAAVYLPGSVQTVGVIDRSLPSEEGKTLDALDKVLSAEGKDLDREGANSAMAGLMNELERSGRFSAVKKVELDGVVNPGSGIFPAALDWNKVEELCTENRLDALFVLSFYDTDAHVETSARPVDVGGIGGVKVTLPETGVKITTRISTGWRIYDNTGKIIPDEFIMEDIVISEGKGINPMKAVEAVQGRKQAVIDVSNRVGQRYAGRIFPQNIRVDRIYYVRGTGNFKIGKRRAQTGNWNGAAELWEKELANPKRKIAGRANFNMAVINEINGDLNSAADFASRSYTDYRNKKALRYLDILKMRMASDN